MPGSEVSGLKKVSILLAAGRSGKLPMNNMGGFWGGVFFFLQPGAEQQIKWGFNCQQHHYVKDSGITSVL